MVTAKMMSEDKGKPCVDRLESGGHHRLVVQQAKRLPPIRTAVVHPADFESLLGAIDAANAGVIVPVLVGPPAKNPRCSRAAQHRRLRL